MNLDMKTTFTLLFIIAFSTLAVHGQDNCSNLPVGDMITDITTTQALDTINAYVDKDWFVILDVRTPGEYNSGHIEEGVNLDYNSSSFTSELQWFDRNKVYLIHCASGSRSALAKAQMETLGFYRVYNMSSGFNSWNGSGYPTTTAVNAIGDACETDFIFENIIVGNSDILTARITNAGNDTLKVLGITDLSSTDFDTDIDTDIMLTGSKEFSFYFFYQPTDDINDNVTFTINTNGGDIIFNLTGTATYPTNILSTASEEISIYQDNINKQISIYGNSQDMLTYSLYSISGISCKTGNLQKESFINYSDLSSGIYILKLNSDKETKTFKMMLE
jgi:rhodanese-related sulfurtransferase